VEQAAKLQTLGKFNFVLHFSHGPRIQINFWRRKIIDSQLISEIFRQLINYCSIHNELPADIRAVDHTSIVLL
jgi:hypothetical protein